MFLKKRSHRNMLLAICVLGLAVLSAGSAFAQEETDTSGMKYIAAALAVGIAGAAASIGMAMAGSAAVGAIVENPDLFGKAFLFVVLIEAVAIYGLLVAILLIF